MPRFRKSKRPVDISISTPGTPPAELIRHLGSLPEGDSRTLAGSSAAIALSIGIPFPDTRDTSGDGDPVRGGDTGLQTAYAALRGAAETIKESSDLCLPLKAVVGAMFVLMKNYDVSLPCLRADRFLILHLLPFQQTVDNVDGVKEIKRRVRSLSGVLASPVSEDDYAEKVRRVELRRFVLSHTNIYVDLLIVLSGGLRGSPQSLTCYLNSARLFASYAMLITPKP